MNRWSGAGSRLPAPFSDTAAARDGRAENVRPFSSVPVRPCGLRRRQSSLRSQAVRFVTRGRFAKQGALETAGRGSRALSATPGTTSRRRSLG
jgi:hypothetical protein